MGPILTFGILTRIVLRKIPSNARNFEYSAAVQTGLTWKIGAIEYRSPHCTRLKNVRILDNVSAKEIFEAAEIDVQFIPSERLDKIFPGIESTVQTPDDPIAAVTKWIKPIGFWRISVAESVLMLEHYQGNASATVVRDTLTKILARFHFLSETPVQFSFENVGVFSTYSIKKTDEKPDRLRFVRGNLYRTKTEIHSDWEFQLPEFSEWETQYFSIVRPNNSTGIEISLRTGKMPIPCEFAAVFCSAFQPFGSGSWFNGEFVTEYTEDFGKPAIRMKNVCFQNLKLASFVKEYTPFTVSGTVHDFHIFNAESSLNYLSATGCFQIVDGEVEKALFHSFVDRFKLEVDPSDILESPRETIPFTACAIYFRLQPDGAVFYPDERWHNALMYQKADESDKNQMVVSFPKDNRQPVSYHTVFSILAPDNAPVVPLTPGLKNLFSMIPVEDVKSTTIPEQKLIVPLSTPIPAEGKPMIADPIKVKPTPVVLFVDPKTKQQP